MPNVFTIAMVLTRKIKEKIIPPFPSLALLHLKSCIVTGLQSRMFKFRTGIQFLTSHLAFHIIICRNAIDIFPRFTLPGTTSHLLFKDSKDSRGMVALAGR